MVMLEERTYDAIPEAFENLIEGIEEHELSDSLQRTQFKQVKSELKNLRLLYKEPNSAEFQDTQRWIQYSLAQISNELPEHIIVRFEYLFRLLRIEQNSD